MTRPRDALLLIDLQEAFFESEQLQRARPELVAAVHRLTTAAHTAEVPTFLITTEHSRDRSTWTLTMLDDDRGFLFHGDRKSTRLNSSHVAISYAVFCLKSQHPQPSTL